jgi:hypothetical protein
LTKLTGADSARDLRRGTAEKKHFASRAHSSWSARVVLLIRRTAVIARLPAYRLLNAASRDRDSTCFGGTVKLSSL